MEGKKGSSVDEGFGSSMGDPPGRSWLESYLVQVAARHSVGDGDGDGVGVRECTTGGLGIDGRRACHCIGARSSCNAYLVRCLIFRCCLIATA